MLIDVFSKTVYIRNNLSVVDVHRASDYEVIGITICLPSGHHLLVCGAYNPSEHNYTEENIMNYIVNFVHNVLDNLPRIYVVFSGDLNKLNVKRIEELSG